MGSPNRLPMINEILTVKDVMVASILNTPSSRFRVIGDAANTVILSFHELGHDWLFTVHNFRPLIAKTEEEDLAVFRELLTDLPLEVDA